MNTQVKQYSRNECRGNILRIQDKIARDFKLDRVYTVPVAAFGISFNIYSDPDCYNQIAEIFYDKEYWNRPR